MKSWGLWLALGSLAGGLYFLWRIRQGRKRKKRERARRRVGLWDEV
jgi:hypothetical protein